ncbi:hypothetical protein EDC04DRAFT_54907 [Pisolithus marmoratus]|nr:hypothetical protein EDC04DRAFT_54907 [Pisolithus marmoratus]
MQAALQFLKTWSVANLVHQDPAPQRSLAAAALPAKNVILSRLKLFGHIITSCSKYPHGQLVVDCGQPRRFYYPHLTFTFLLISSSPFPVPSTLFPMPVPKSWSLFRRFRITVLSFAAILCLLWSILIAVYTAKNWSSYEKGQRGVFSGLVALDFLSSILIYLMVVVKYRYWPDAARTAVLIGLHAAGTITVMALKPHLPCNAFGGRSTCNTWTDVIIYGSWTITGFLGSYGVVLPFAAGLPRGTELDLESASDRTAGDKPEESRVARRRGAAALSYIRRCAGMVTTKSGEDVTQNGAC